MVKLNCGNLVNQKSLDNSENKGTSEKGLEKMTSKTEDLSKYSELMKLLNDDDDLSKAGMNKFSGSKDDQATCGNTVDVEMKKKIHSDFIATLKNSRNAVLAKFFLTKSCPEPRPQAAQTGRRRTATTSGQKTAPAPKKMKYSHVINKPLLVESRGDVSSSTRGAGSEQADRDPNSFSPPAKLDGNQRMAFTNQTPQVIDRPGSSCEFQKSIDMARCQPKVGSRDVQTNSNLSDFLANNHLIGQPDVPVSLQNFENSGISEIPHVPYINLSLMPADRAHGWNLDQSLGFQNDRKGLLMCSEPGLIWREVNNTELMINAGNLPSNYLVDDKGEHLALLGAKSIPNGKHNLINIPQVTNVVPEVKFGKRMSSDCREMPSCGKENNASDFINAFDCVDHYERDSYETVSDCQLASNLGALKQEGPDEYALDLRTKVRSYRSVQELDNKWMAVDKTIVTSLVDAIMGDSDALIESLMNEPRSNCFSEEVQWSNCYRSTTQLPCPTYPTKFNEFHHRSPTTPSSGRRGWRSYTDNDDVNNVGNYVSMLNDVASHESDDVSSMCDDYGWSDGFSMKWKTNILSRAKDEVC